MAEGKWITGLNADTPVPEAARTALDIRLGVVYRYLKASLEEPDRDPENVHQLRVGLRRVGAALDVFVSCLPRRLHDKIRHRLRRLRRAAGSVRDWDVFLLELDRHCGTEPGRDFLFGYGFQARSQAQKKLDKVGKPLLQCFADLRAKVMGSIDDSARANRRLLRDFASQSVLEHYQRFAKTLRGDLNDPADLHEIRKSGKRLRYTMELFAKCFAPEFRSRLYPMVEAMQEILGKVNDSYVAEAKLADLKEKLRRGWPEKWPRFRPVLDVLLKFHRQRLPAEKRRFLKWHQSWLRAHAGEQLKKLVKAASPGKT
ncbi:MAG: hypothetical protein KatS3mg105_1028 [Gemmatales bacterium]|nr:MAG: hypothetical protein KatS3mg105_1028 [Gemmatales bacterium]